MMNCYRVTFYNGHIVRKVLGHYKVDSTTLWVEANNDHHAVAEATMLAMAGTGNENAQEIGRWLVAGEVTNVYAVIETN